MARMLPSTISPSVKSNAERKIFELFKNAEGTDDWIVLHSLGISNHNRNVFGETDFFVLVPNLGVYSIEVKGGRVKRSDGIWHFTNRYGKTSTKKVGPFEQARESAFSIAESIKQKVDAAHWKLEKVFFGSGVMFPDIIYDSTGIDEEQWQVFDARDGNNIVGYIQRLAENSKKKWEDKYGPLNKDRLPTKKDVNYLASILRGDFDIAVSLGRQLRYSEEALLRLTEEQYRCLDQIDDNPRSLIQGAAGTGKTLLAIEEVKRSVAKGEKVAFFCYNTNLGEWLSHYFSSLDENLKPAYVGTLHKYMMNLVRSKEIPVNEVQDEDLHQFFSIDLPQAILSTSLDYNDMFDKIVVDEAQDLITPIYLDLFDYMLKKGVERGQWVMLGDFESQAIYSNDYSGEEMKEFLDIMTAYIRFKLTTNCRNTKPITQEIQTVTGVETPNVLSTKVDGLPVNYKVCLDNADMTKQLEQLLGELIKDYVEPSQITILSPHKRENSIVADIKRIAIENYKPEGNSGISFSSIQGFKGLENVVIILTDIKSFELKQLMYVGLSRARSALFVLETNDAFNEYQELLKRRFIQ